MVTVIGINFKARDDEESDVVGCRQSASGWRRDNREQFRLLASMSLSDFQGFSCAMPFTGRLQCRVQTGLKLVTAHAWALSVSRRHPSS